jgi:hypothetical protein
MSNGSADTGFSSEPVGSTTLPCPGGPADLIVHVGDEYGNAIEGADVDISGAESRSGKSDATGNATFSGVAPGGYQVSASKAGFVKGASAASVPPSATTSANVELVRPAVTITELGFSDDFDLTTWDATSASAGPKITDPVWKTGGVLNNPACYKMDSNNMKLWPRVSISPTPVGSATLSLKAISSAPALEFRIDGTAGGTEKLFENMPLLSGNLEKKVQTTMLSLKWSYSWEGDPWKTAGSTGPHKIYQVYDTPIESPLFDFALDRSCWYAAGDNDVDKIADKVSKGISGDLIYDPGDAPDTHVLGYYPHGKCLCMNNAALMAYLCRSLGIPATMIYIWGGATGTEYTTFKQVRAADPTMFWRPTFMVVAPKNDLAEENPHFTYHVVTEVNGKTYDPSYGTIGLISLAETAPGASRQTKSASVVGGKPGGWPPFSTKVNSPWVCPHKIGL